MNREVSQQEFGRVLEALRSGTPLSGRERLDLLKFAAAADVLTKAEVRREVRRMLGRQKTVTGPVLEGLSKARAVKAAKRRQHEIKELVELEQLLEAMPRPASDEPPIQGPEGG